MLDAHLHVVDPRTAGADQTGHPDGAWWEALDASPEAIVRRTLRSDIGGGVLVQAVGAHGFDNTLVLEAAAALGSSWGAVAAVGAADPDPLATIERAVAGGATGMRLFSVPLPTVPWLDGDLGRSIATASIHAGLTPTVCCLPEELAAAARLAADYADAEFAIDHAGFVEIGGDEGDLASLTQHENVILKVSTGVFDHSAVSPSATISRLIDLVGADRIAWGSDYPQIRDRDYAQLVDLALEAVAALDDRSRTAILGLTADRLWISRGI